MNAHQQYEHWNLPPLPHPLALADSSDGNGQVAQENHSRHQFQHPYHYGIQGQVPPQPQHFTHAPLPALADPFAQSWQPAPEVVPQYDPGTGPAYAEYGTLQAQGLGHSIPQPVTMYRPEPMVAIGNAVEQFGGDAYADYTVMAQFQLQMRLPLLNIGQTAYAGSGGESATVYNPMPQHAHSGHVASNPALFTNSRLDLGPSSAVTNDRVSQPIASGPPSTQDQRLGHGQQIVHPDRGNAPPPMFYSNAESWSSMPRTAQMVSPPGFGTTVERSTAPVGLDVQRNNNYTPPANSQADNGDSRATKRRGASSKGGPVRPKRGRAAVAPYSTTRRKTAITRGDVTTATANEGPATPSQPPVGQDWNAPWQSGTATKYTASAAKTYLETLPETEWHDSAGFFCPFKGCRKHQSGARYDTYTSLVGHVRRCGPDRECELCKEMIARGYQPYEMQRHRRGGNKDGKNPTQPLKKKDNRTPCTVTEACGGDDKHEAIYAHLKSKNELYRVDSLQFGDDSYTYRDYLGPRMRRHRSSLGEGPSTRRTATTEAERTQSPATREDEYDE